MNTYKSFLSLAQSPSENGWRYFTQLLAIQSHAIGLDKKTGIGLWWFFILGLMLVGFTSAATANDLLKVNNTRIQAVEPIQVLKTPNSNSDNFTETVSGASGLQFRLERNTQSAGLIPFVLMSATPIEVEAPKHGTFVFQPDESDPNLLHVLLRSAEASQSDLVLGNAFLPQHLATVTKKEALALDVIIDSSSYRLNVKAVENLDSDDTGSDGFPNGLRYESQPTFFPTRFIPDYFAGASEAIAAANAGIQMVSGALFADPDLEIPVSVVSESPALTLYYVSESENDGNPGSNIDDGTVDFFESEKITSYEETSFSETISTITTTISTSTTTEERPDPAEAEPFPATHRDLDELIQAANALKALGAICAEYECPELDCSAANEILQALLDGKVYLRFMHYHLQQANNLYLQHWQSLVEQYGNTGTSQYNTLTALAWQQTLHNFGAAMLDIASFYEYVQDFVKDVGEGNISDDMSPEDLLDRINDAFEALKDLEDGVNNMTSNYNNGKGSGTSINDFENNLTGSFIQTQKSTLSNVKSIIEEALKHGKDWKSLLKAGKASAALGQIAGRYLEIYSKSLIEERIQHYQDLVRDAAAEEKAIAEAYLQLQRVQRRRHKVEDALAVLNDVSGTIRPCLQKICSDISITFRAVSDIQAQPFNQQQHLNSKLVNYQAALIFGNGKIRQVTEALAKTLEIEEGCEDEEAAVMFIFEPVIEPMPGTTFTPISPYSPTNSYTPSNTAKPLTNNPVGETFLKLPELQM